MVPTARLAVGIHLDSTHMSVVMVDLLARTLAERILEAPTDNPEGDIARILAAVEDLCAETRQMLRTDETESHDGTAPPHHPASEPRDPTSDDPEKAGYRPELLGIGIAASGGVDSDRGVMMDPPWLPGWREVPVTSLIHEATGLPVMLDKDTHAALAAEIWVGRHAPRGTVLYLYVGDGIGSAVAEDGVVRRGDRGRAGEIGHLGTGLGTERCRCGRLGCLSLYTDADALLQRAEALGILDADAGGQRRDRLKILTESAAAGDQLTLALLERPGAALAEAMRTLVDIHDAEQVIIGGPYWDQICDVALPLLHEHADHEVAHGFSAVQLVPSTLGRSVGAIGAAVLFLTHDLSPGNPHGLG